VTYSGKHSSILRYGKATAAKSFIVQAHSEPNFDLNGAPLKQAQSIILECKGSPEIKD